MFNLKLYKKKIKTEKRLFKEKQLNNLRKLSKENPQKFWREIKSLRQEDNVKQKDDNVINPEEWVTHFKTLNNLVDNKEPNKDFIQHAAQEWPEKLNISTDNITSLSDTGFKRHTGDILKTLEN